jgi:hypothetical protein
MWWHKDGIRDREDINIMSHPANAEAWHALDHFDPEFARDLRSVRLGLSTDGFQPYRSNSTIYCYNYIYIYILKYVIKEINLFIFQMCTYVSP